MPNKKCAFCGKGYDFGTSRMIHHPDGFYYIVAFLDKAKTLKHSKIVWIRAGTLRKIKVD